MGTSRTASDTGLVKAVEPPNMIGCQLHQLRFDLPAANRVRRQSVLIVLAIRSRSSEGRSVPAVTESECSSVRCWCR